MSTERLQLASSKNLLITVVVCVTLGCLLIVLIPMSSRQNVGSSNPSLRASPEKDALGTTVVEVEPQTAVRRLLESPPRPAQESGQVVPASAALVGAAKEELATQINESLDGFLYINHLLDQVLAFADLPVDQQVDFEYERSDGVGYRIQGTPDGTTAHFVVGLKPFERDGEEFRLFQLEIQIGADAQPEFYRDAIREGPRIHLSVDYDENGQPRCLALVTERRVALKHSRRAGINAYEGRFTSGAGYKIDLGTGSVMSETFGVINGIYSNGEQFQGISPLRGDLEIDPSMVVALLNRLMKRFEELQRESR